MKERYRFSITLKCPGEYSQSGQTQVEVADDTIDLSKLPAILACIERVFEAAVKLRKDAELIITAKRVTNERRER